MQYAQYLSVLLAVVPSTSTSNTSWFFKKGLKSVQQHAESALATKYFCIQST